MKRKPVIKYILFDFGDVLIVDTEKVFDSLFHKERLSAEAKNQYEKMIHLTERGERPVSALLKVMVKIFRLKMSPKQLELMMTQPALIGPMWQLANILSENYSVAILTNNQKGWPEKQAESAGISLKKFKIFNSALIGMRKPGSQIYEYVQKRLRAKPEQIVFIDDRDYNLAEPKKLGWKTILFTGNVPAVIKALKKLGVKARI